MLHNIKSLSAVILLALVTYGCDNDNNNTNGTGTPDVSVTPAETLGQILSAGNNSDSRALDLNAIQAELNSLAGGSRNTEPVIVMPGDTVTTLLTRAQTQ